MHLQDFSCFLTLTVMVLFLFQSTSSLSPCSAFLNKVFLLHLRCLTSTIMDKLIEEFKKVMGLMRAQNRQGAGHRDGRRFGLKVAEPVENGGLLEYFFGKDGRTCLQHERFVQFLGDLHDEVYVYISNLLLQFLL